MFAWLAGCTPNRASEIDGTAFPIESTALEVVPGAFGDDDLLVVTLSSLPDVCAAQASFRAAAGDAEDGAALASAWNAAYPLQFTEIVLAARVVGSTWPPNGEQWPGLAWDAFPEEDSVVFASWLDHRAPRDAAYFDGEADPGGYETTWLSDGGFVEWRAGLPSQRLAGRFATHVTDRSGEVRGAGDVRFDAETCAAR
jgi:hypothetical protein